MGVAKIEAIRAFVAAIKAGVSELNTPNGVIVDQAPPELGLDFPKLAVVLGAPRLILDQEHETGVANNAAGTVVMCLGRWQVSGQLRLAHATPFQRAVLEEKVTNLFLQREGAPGVLLTDVAVGVTDFGAFRCAWELDDTSWDNEMAFSSVYWSVQNITGEIPVLVTRSGIYTIDQLILGITSDMERTFTSAEVQAGVLLHSVKVNEDGTFTTI